MPRPSQRLLLHALHLVVTFVSFILVQREVTAPYLDEIFHIPQTQAYCRGEWTIWDPSITTPPGLYAISAIFLRLLHIGCSTTALRSTNLVLALLVPGLISSILHTNPSSSATRTNAVEANQASTAKAYPSIPIHSRSIFSYLLLPSATALVIASFPLVHFFQNLYYTDVASLVGVLGCWSAARRGRHGRGALLGAWSITVRQTNVVWVAFIVADAVLRLSGEQKFVERKKLEDTATADKTSEARADPLIRDVTSPVKLVSSIVSTVKSILRKPQAFARVVAPHLPVFLGFLAFLKWNGGIVLGHKEQHKPVVHFPQVLYWLAFSTIMLLPALVNEGFLRTTRGTLKVGLGSPLKGIVSATVLGLMNFAVHRYTIIHPFLLADNRHYVFYLFRWVFIPYPWARYAVTPVYLVCGWAWLWRLRNSTTLLSLLSLLACAAATLIPTPLIEPRYFLIPTIILRLILAQDPTIRYRTGGRVIRRPSTSLWVEWAWYTVINVATVGLFLTRKFRWDGWEGWMRFMW